MTANQGKGGGKHAKVVHGEALESKGAHFYGRAKGDGTNDPTHSPRGGLERKKTGQQQHWGLQRKVARRKNPASMGITTWLMAPTARR